MKLMKVTIPARLGGRKLAVFAAAAALVMGGGGSFVVALGDGLGGSGRLNGGRFDLLRLFSAGGLFGSLRLLGLLGLALLGLGLAGAAAVEVGAANLTEPFACKNIIEALPAAMEKYGIKSLTEIIGGAHNG